MKKMSVPVFLLVAILANSVFSIAQSAVGQPVISQPVAGRPVASRSADSQPAVNRPAKADTIHKLTPEGTSAVWGTVDGVSVEGMVEGPATENTPLQVACLFEYTEGDIFNSPPALPAAVNGMVHLDLALNGIITDMRKSGKFAGHALETLLIIPPPGAIAAKKLLLIGLGDRTKFRPELMITVGSVAMREALRLGVSSFAFGSDLKDAGIDSPTGLIATDMVKGAFEAYRVQDYLQTKNMGQYTPLAKVTVLAGPSFFTISGEGIRDAVKELNTPK